MNSPHSSNQDSDVSRGISLPKRAELKRTTSIDSESGGLFDKLAKKEFLAIWTINDQKKLIALNSLYNRSLEFHQNVHIKDSPLMLSASQGISLESAINEPKYRNPLEYDHSSQLATVITFSADKSKRLLQNYNFHQFSMFCQHSLFNSIQEESPSTAFPSKSSKPFQSTSSDDSMDKNPSSASIDMSETEKLPASSSEKKERNDYYWIHLKDLCGLDLLLKHNMNIHELIYIAFHDLRHHSSILPYGNELFLTNVVCTLQNETSSFHLYKVYMYMKDNILITYETELFPLLSAPDEKDASDFHSHLPGFSEGTTTPGHSEGSSIPFAGGNIPGKGNPIPSTAERTTSAEIRTISVSSPISNGTAITEKIMQLFFKHMSKLKEKVIELGVFYLIYELSLHILTFYDSSLEYLSSSLSYFNRIVHLNLLHRERMTMKIKIHMLSAGINLLRKSIEGCVETISKLSHFEFDCRGSCSLSVDTPLYLLDIYESYIFKRSSLQKQQEEIKRIETELDATIGLRTTNTNTILSLIATVFFPLNFFAGVFGMNFAEDGGYTMALVNASYGPHIFVMMCLCK
jgi:Mg2+ and Co2+ transporter CorA